MNGVPVYRVGSASDPGASKPERSGGLRVHIYKSRPLSKIPKHGSNEDQPVARTDRFHQNLTIRVSRGRVERLIKIIKTMLRMLLTEIIFALCKKILQGVNFGDFSSDGGPQYEKSVYTILMRKTFRYITG